MLQKAVNGYLSSWARWLATGCLVSATITGCAAQSAAPSAATLAPTIATAQVPTPVQVAAPTLAPSTVVVQATSTALPRPTATLEPAPTPVPVATSAKPGPLPPTATISARTSDPATPTRPPAPGPTQAPPAPTSTPSRPAGPAATVASWTDRLVDGANGQGSDTDDVSGQGIKLAGHQGTYAASGEYLSTVRETGFGFDNAVLSWNASSPAGTYLRFELRVRDSLGWSNWYAMGEWGPDGGRSISGQADARGRVNVDTLKLNSPATAMQYRVKLTSSTPQSTPVVRQISVAYANMGSGLSGPVLARVPSAVRDLNVPQHSQLEEDPSYRSLICSATSLAMLMQYWGKDKSVAQVVAGVKDKTAGIYGNWTLNAAYAGANGLDARVERFYSMVQLEQQIAQGRPVAISIAFDPGELSGAPIQSTSGHLIVVRGFTADGNVIVNDPIAPNSKSARLVYDRGELTKIWLRSGGIAYVLSPGS